MCRHELAEITLTIVTAFATYLVANNLFGSSGVLAVVFLGMHWPGYICLHTLQRSKPVYMPPFKPAFNRNYLACIGCMAIRV